VAYTGDMSGQPITDETSQEACKLRCQNTVGCAHFTFYANSGNCHLQDSGASRQAETGAVSGEPGCQEPTATSTGGSNNNAGSPSTFSGTGSSTGSSTGSGSSNSNTLGSQVDPLASSASASDPFAAGNAESMPADVGSAMVVGSAQAQGSFSGLSAVFSLDWMPSAQNVWRVGVFAAGTVLLAAIAYSRRLQRSSASAAQREAFTAIDEDVVE